MIQRCLLALLLAAPALAESAPEVGTLVTEARSELEAALTAALNAEAARLAAQRAHGDPTTVRASLLKARDQFVAMEGGVREARRRLMRLSELLLGSGRLVAASDVDGMRRQLESVRRPGLKGLLRRPSGTLRALEGRLDIIERRLARGR